MTCFEVGVISFVVRDRGLELESSDTSHYVTRISDIHFSNWLYLVAKENWGTQKQ